jgi:hypothetical protein
VSDPINVNLFVDGPITIILKSDQTEHSAIGMRIALGGNVSTSTPNVNQMTVDTTNETVELQFIDDRQNQTSAPPGAAVTWSDPNGVVNFTPDPDNPFRAQVVPTGTPGNAQITPNVVGFNDASGNPVPNPNPETVRVDPGAAVGERLVLSNSNAGQTTPDTNPTPTPSPDPSTPTPTPGAPTAPDPGTTTPTDPTPAPVAPVDPNAPNAPTDPATTTPTPGTPADPNAPAPVTPDAPTAATSTDDLERSVYTYSADPSTVDANSWPTAGYVADDGSNQTLYHYVGDTAPRTGHRQWP